MPFATVTEKVPSCAYSFAKRVYSTYSTGTKERQRYSRKGATFRFAKGYIDPRSLTAFAVVGVLSATTKNPLPKMLLILQYD